jgi:acyl transferase domain-containing protein
MELPSEGGGFGATLTFEQGLKVQEAMDGGVFAAMEWDPHRTLFTGHREAIERVLPELSARGIKHFFLAAEGFAAHSPLLDSLRPAFVQRLEGFSGDAPKLPLYSGWCGGRLGNSCFDAAHWWNVITDPVFVARAVRTVLQDGYTQFLEISFTPDTVYPIDTVSADLGKSGVVKSSIACLSGGEMPFERDRPNVIERALRMCS